MVKMEPTQRTPNIDDDARTAVFNFTQSKIEQQGGKPYLSLLSFLGSVCMGDLPLQTSLA